jgi:hypothetical protein
MPKWSQPKFARVVALETSSDGRTRKARISYTKANQLKTDANDQLAGGPIHESTRCIDQLIPIDDASQLRSVQTMLEKACLTATKPNNNPSASPPPLKHIINSAPTKLNDNDKVEEKDEGNDEVVEEDEDKDVDDDEDKKDVSKDPICKYKVTVNNENRRVTRSNKDPATPHCSLITNTEEQQNTTKSS